MITTVVTESAGNDGFPLWVIALIIAILISLGVVVVTIILAITWKIKSRGIDMT